MKIKSCLIMAVFCILFFAGANNAFAEGIKAPEVTSLQYDYTGENIDILKDAVYEKDNNVIADAGEITVSEKTLKSLEEEKGFTCITDPSVKEAGKYAIVLVPSEGFEYSEGTFQTGKIGENEVQFVVFEAEVVNKELKAPVQTILQFTYSGEEIDFMSAVNADKDKIKITDGSNIVTDGVSLKSTEETKGFVVTVDAKAVATGKYAFVIEPAEGYSFTLGDYKEYTKDDKTYQYVLCEFDVVCVGGHEFTDYISKGDGTHYRRCKKCGVIETEKCLGGTATCTQKAVCKICGGEYGEVKEHDFSGKDLSEKYLKTPATCSTKGVYYYSCVYCGLKSDETFEVPETGTHSFNTKNWVYDSKGHWHKCENCDVKIDYAEHVSAGAATVGAPEVCKICGYVINPALTHQHTLTYVPAVAADCIHPGNMAYYYCSSCNKYFSDAKATREITDKSSVVV
ncbi:MAG: hypothetical protein K6F84_00420, partial [Lachnospiraceae bacterium]|nr:hypothetical protein [Lachnospiraceae bacterium]